MQPPATPELPPPPPPAASRVSARPTPLLGVRGLILGWCLWLLGSWLTTLTIEANVPAVRWMVFASMTGMLLIWPTLRLSLGAEPEVAEASSLPAWPSLGRTLADWCSLNLVYQAVIWPLQLIADWGFMQTLWLNGAILAWSLLIGAVVAWGRSIQSGTARLIAMVVCVGLLLGEPAWRGLGGGQGLDTLRWSGPRMFWMLTRPPEAFELGVLPSAVMTVGAAAGAGWGALAAWASLRRKAMNPRQGVLPY